MDSEKLFAAGTLSRQLEALSGSSWTNVQTPVRQGFEAVEATAQGLAEELAASRRDVNRLEARLVGMEDMLSRRLDSNARSTREEVDVLRCTLGRVSGLGHVQTTANEACRALESEMTKRMLELERSIENVRKESMKGVEAARQAVAGKAGLSDLEAFCPRGEAATRADLQDLENRLASKADKDALAFDLATKVSWTDFERLLHDKADASAFAELCANCATVAAVARVEIGLARAVGMEEVRAFVETQTGDIQAMSPALERLLAARAREEKESAERSPASSVTRGELPGLIQACLRRLTEGGIGDDDERLSPSRIDAAQVHAAIAAGRESTLRTVEAQLGRARGAQQEELLTQAKRLHVELDEGLARLRARTEGIDKSLAQAKEELVSLLNAKAYKADVSLLLQGKADSKDLGSLSDLVRTKVDVTEHQETTARARHLLTALSGEVGGLRGELRVDVDRLSSRLLAKADSDDLLALKKTMSGATAVAVEAATAAAIAARMSDLSGGGGTDASTPNHTDDPENSSLLRSRNSGGGSGGALPFTAHSQGTASAMRRGNDGGERGVAAPPCRGVGSGLSREEARLLIRAELKRADIANKISREEASVQAEACAARALTEAIKAADAVDQRVRNISDRLERSTVAVSQPHVERLFAAQSDLELRIARSLSLGRWLWRGVNFSEMYATAVATAARNGVGTGASGDVDVDGFGLSRNPLFGGSVRGCGGGGIWVPWEAEVANTSPQCLKWTPGGTSMTAVVPGLYLVSCGFFSRQPFVATVHLNGAPVFSFPSYQTEPSAASGENKLNPTAAPSPADGKQAPGSRMHHRYKHPAGEILSRSTREYLACPAGGVLSVKFEMLSGNMGDRGIPSGSSAKIWNDAGAGGTVGPGKQAEVAENGMLRSDGLRERSKESSEGSLELLSRPQGFLEVQKL